MPEPQAGSRMRKRAQPVDEGVALGFGLGARDVEALAEVAPGVPAASAGGFQHGRHDRFDLRLRRLPFGLERAQHDRLDDLHDLVGIGVMRADLRPLVGVEEALEQCAEDGRVDQAPVEARGGEHEADLDMGQRQGGAPVEQPAVELEDIFEIEVAALRHVAEEAGEIGLRLFRLALGGPQKLLP